ncbi:hypothetical protein ACFE04_030559 [Oxalis oulophora]
MWRTIVKQAVTSSSKKLNFSTSSSSIFHQKQIFLEKLRPAQIIKPNFHPNPALGFPQFHKLSKKSTLFRGYASAAEPVCSSEPEAEESASEQMQELMEEMSKQDEKVKPFSKQPKKMIAGMGAAKYQMLKKRQIKMETEVWDQAAKEYQELLTDMCEKKLAPNLPYVKSLFLGWFEPLREAIVNEQKAFEQKKHHLPNHAEYIDKLPADKMAVITMHKMMGLLMSDAGGVGRVTVVQAASKIGEAIENEARIHKFLEKSKKKKTVPDSKPEEQPGTVAVSQDMLDIEQKKLKNKVNTLLKKQKLRQVNFIMKGQDDSKPWGQEGHVKIGSRLIELLVENAYIQPPLEQLGENPPDIRPAFLHTLKTITSDAKKGGRRFGFIEADPMVCKGLEKTAKHMVIPYMPMLIPPVDWTGYDKGAYLFLPSYLMRTHGSKALRKAMRRANMKELKTVFEALNTLGSTKWKVNKRVLGVIDRIWANGGRLADLVDCEDVGSVPFPEQPDTEDETELRKWKWKLKAAEKENKERHSQRCNVELILAVARKMKEEEGFYYPHSLDFRGRAYPMHPHLNHLGSDLCRGILEFAEGRPIGKSGLRWLKIHLANVYATGGVDKLSYDGRIAFTENNLDDIFDSADRPLEGRRWWLNAEDPFQCLATCMNLSDALRSSTPENFVSHIPVHMDGSCNGLQHYAAIGRDKLGAEAVNLVAGEKPADVYSGIAARVLEIMKKDAQNDPETDANAPYARLLVDQVDRKLVKQTVMTSVYGVTYIGARDQIKKRLIERDVIADDKNRFVAACYAAKTTLHALEEMFEAARSIMNWLGDCAKVISAENQAVKWTTPLGLPVLQHYRVKGRLLIKTSLQTLALQQETDKINRKRQQTAFPPNYVHSLDGSHMMMTAIACKQAGLNFAGVHDSYWTHACDVDTMNGILREKFVELYEAPVLENLLKSFQKEFPNLKFPPLPERGDFDLREVGILLFMGTKIVKGIYIIPESKTEIQLKNLPRGMPALLALCTYPIFSKGDSGEIRSITHIALVMAHCQMW